MKQRRICVALLCLFFFCQETLQARDRNCRRTNKKPFRYCLDRVCTSNQDCRSNEQCLCDGDCGLSCIQNGTDCGKPEISKAVRVRYSGGTKFQSVARFQCKGKQYTLRGSKKRVCRGIGKWDGRSAKCRILCEHPGEIVSGNNNGNKKSYRVGNTVRYWCFPGYDMEGAKVIECNKRGKWNSPPPQCTTPSCRKPTPPDNAYILSRRKLKEKYRFNEVVAYRCEHGYYTSGSAFRRCLASGWSNSNFRCIPKSCGDPGTPTNGKRIGYVFTFKKKVYFTCNRGFLRVGPEYRQCQSNQKWSDKTPTCEPIDCGRLPEPQHGEKIEETSTTFGGKVVFVCKKEGFELKGSARRVCGENGRWSGNRTTCERVECPDPGTLIKGVRIPDKSKYVFEDRIDFKCDTNHTLRGDPFIICRKTKDWTGSGSVPQCLAPCRDPGIPIGGRRFQHSFLHNSVVQFRCNPGWTMEGSHTIRCNNGRWDRDPPTCNKMCPKPNRYPANGGIYRSDQYVLHGSSIRFYCRGGYNLVGQEYVRCRNGTWNSRQPTCKPVECRDPGTPRNGVRRPNKNKYVFEDRIDFQCRTNYTLSGDRFITCQKDKSWSRSVPQCLAPCRDPGIPIGGSRLQHSFLHNSFVQFRCNPGWTREGSRTIRCNNGRWDRDPPTCNKMCARPNIYPVNGGILGMSGSYRHNEYITFYCRGGYQLVGQEYVRCRNGTWNSRQPTCKPVECSDPGTPRNGVRRPNKNKYVFEDRIDFQCRTNYTLSGDPFITCQKDKSWSRSVPQCLAPCRDPGTPNDGQRVGDSFLHGNQVRFSCRQGWNIEGSQTISCYNSRWNQPTPECNECGSALGMKNRKIPDGRIRASSTRDHYHTAKEGRLNGPWAWCSGRQTQPYLEIDFGKPYRITALATQGSTYYRMWVGKYAVATNLAGSLFKPYKETGHDKVFIGNTDYGSVKKQNMKNPVIARRLRILPVKRGGFKHSSACMRVEIYGCDLPLDCIMTGSRVVAKWTRVHNAGHMYYKAYVTKGSRYWRANLETENHGSPRYKLFPQFAVFPFVLDVPPKHEKLQVGTKVLAPWGYRYYTATINRTRDRDDRYKVRADDGDMGTFTIDQIRLLKAPRFCE